MNSNKVLGPVMLMLAAQVEDEERRECGWLEWVVRALWVEQPPHSYHSNPVHVNRSLCWRGQKSNRLTHFAYLRGHAGQISRRLLQVQGRDGAKCWTMSGQRPPARPRGGLPSARSIGQRCTTGYARPNSLYLRWPLRVSHVWFRPRDISLWGTGEEAETGRQKHLHSGFCFFACVQPAWAMQCKGKQIKSNQEDRRVWLLLHVGG